MTPQQQVFDNLLLRHLILSKVEYMKYKENLNSFVNDIVNDCILKKWYRYCNCNECIFKRLQLQA